MPYIVFLVLGAESTDVNLTLCWAGSTTASLPLLTRPRHRYHLQLCAASLRRFVEDDMSVDMAAEELRGAMVLNCWRVLRAFCCAFAACLAATIGCSLARPVTACK